jgi:hypothetical protein
MALSSIVSRYSTGSERYDRTHSILYRIRKIRPNPLVSRRTGRIEEHRKERHSLRLTILSPVLIRIRHLLVVFDKELRDRGIVNILTDSVLFSKCVDIAEPFGVVP